MDDELYHLKEKLKSIIDEKIAIENELNHIERVEEGRINELDRLNSIHQNATSLKH